MRATTFLNYIRGGDILNDEYLSWVNEEFHALCAKGYGLYRPQTGGSLID